MRLLHFAALSMLLLFPSFQVASTPTEPEEGGTGITMSYTQNYIDMSDEAIDSDSRPEIVLIMLMDHDSEDAARHSYDELAAPSMDGTDFDITNIDDIGDEAMFVESVDEGGDHGAWIITRADNVVIAAFVTGAPAEPAIAMEITRFILDSGPSDEPATVDAEGIVSGGWTEAFPGPEDIEGLGTFTPAQVTEMPGADAPQTPPLESTPIIATPAT